jgi:hypothetical protein
MSVILWGPQGSGKTRHASRIAARYGCVRWVECDDASPYARLRRDPVGFKAGDTLYITNEPPPARIGSTRRVVHITTALQAAAEPPVAP